MRENIYTIPITEVFEPRDGCPFCRLYDILEERAIEYIMGAAMMEPDVRLMTNKLGFCQKHLTMMIPRKNRLSIALMLETHLDEIMNRFIDEKNFDKKGSKLKESVSDSCFVCKEVEEAVATTIKNAVTRYAQDPEFAKLYQEQPGFCIKHYEMLCSVAHIQIGKKLAVPFIRVTTDMAKIYAQGIRDNVHEFVISFDYRNSGKPISEKASVSVEEAARYCTSSSLFLPDTSV